MWVATPTESAKAAALRGRTVSAAAGGAATARATREHRSDARTGRTLSGSAPAARDHQLHADPLDGCATPGPYASPPPGAADGRTRPRPRLPAGPARRGAHLRRDGRRVAGHGRRDAPLRRRGDGRAPRRPPGHHLAAAAPRRGPAPLPRAPAGARPRRAAPPHDGRR